MNYFLQAVESTIGYDVVYNLYEAEAGIFLPIAYVANRDDEGNLLHIQQKAIEETIGSYGLELDEAREKLFALVARLQPKNLETHFSVPKKKVLSLPELLANTLTAKTVTQYIHRNLAELLAIIYQHRLPLAWQLERKVLVKDFILGFEEEILEPSLYFKRTDAGVFYQLRLQDWLISQKNVIPITNEPAWLVVDNKLCRAENINGNMVKPFLSKNEVVIPPQNVRTYFQTFILKVAAKTDVQAEGFDIESKNILEACEVSFFSDFMRQQGGIQVKMNYGAASFDWNETRKKRSILDFESEDDVRILHVERNVDEEKKKLEALKKLGLESINGQYFQIVDSDNTPLILLEWFLQHVSVLGDKGFQVQAIQHDDIAIAPVIPTISLRSTTHNDWFDIQGIVQAGAYEFPFLQLVSYLKSGNRFYPLPDGTYFLIPEEWMSRYGSIAQFGKRSGDGLRLEKSQFTLLQESELLPEDDSLSDAEIASLQAPDTLRATLRNYQLEGFQWLASLYHRDLGACLADDMGLGKTLQTISMLLYAKELKKQNQPAIETNGTTQLSLFSDQEILNPLHALIVLPSSLVFNWAEELRRFAPSLSVYRHVGSGRHKDIRLLQRFDVILTTYQTALRDVELLQQQVYEYIVLDEAQQIKNKDSKVFKSVNKLAANHKISLSGTPIENSLSDLWAQMQFINPNLLNSFTFFKKEFIIPIERYDDDEKKELLRNLVKPYLLRRTKEEVARDLPELSIQVFFSEMEAEQKKEYESEKSAARNELLEQIEAVNPNYKFMVLQSLTRLRQMANHPRLADSSFTEGSGKFNDVLEHWEVIRKGGHKVLFFSSFVQYLELFRQHFEKNNIPYAWLSGDSTQAQRAKEIKKFQEDPAIKAFFISIKSGGTGLNLTAADYVFILDPWWNPTTEQQAIARAHRIGQEQHVIAIKFITRNSIEEKILNLQEKKQKLAGDIIDQSMEASLTKEDLMGLLE